MMILNFLNIDSKNLLKTLFFGTIERNDLILDELNTKLGDDFVLDNFR